VRPRFRSSLINNSFRFPFRIYFAPRLRIHWLGVETGTKTVNQRFPFAAPAEKSCCLVCPLSVKIWKFDLRSIFFPFSLVFGKETASLPLDVPAPPSRSFFHTHCFFLRVLLEASSSGVAWNFVVVESFPLWKVSPCDLLSTQRRSLSAKKLRPSRFFLPPGEPRCLIMSLPNRSWPVLASAFLSSSSSPK